MNNLPLVFKCQSDKTYENFNVVKDVTLDGGTAGYDGWIVIAKQMMFRLRLG